MFRTRHFSVVPTLPEPIQFLRELAQNMWWCWNYDAVNLFERLDPKRWRTTEHNPLRLLADVPQKRLDDAANDPAYIAHLDRVRESLRTYLGARTWFASTYPELKDRTIGYFSMEFGLHECLPMYSGGLGVLAGDHMKAASDLGVPLVGIGLLYHSGYFQQYLSNDGWQFEEYPKIDPHHVPMERQNNGESRPVTVSCRVGPRDVAIQVYRIRVGRVNLFLLDTDLYENDPSDRELTMRLYAGDQEMRIRQECVLGFGGCATLRALGYDPSLFHMNEGHSAFLALARMGHMMESAGLTFAEAREAVASTNMFTTHTPVPAGIDVFPRGLVEKYLSPYAQKMHVSIDDLMTIGRTHSENTQEPFSMANLALRLSCRANGVSRRHGQVAREMWRSNWPDVPIDEIPISSVTNGVHLRSWLSPEIARLFERYLGPSWINRPDDLEIWERLDDIPDAELWRAHERSRERLVVEMRARLREHMTRRSAPPSQVEAADEVFNPEALTIGFARRFASYKRATLMLKNEERLLKIVSDVERPVQFIFAGKAHPLDDKGKELIKRLVQFARGAKTRLRFAFIENYNMSVARRLVQGVDLWMNTPTKPLEASGTSGMKVAPNGGINFSILDGWWCEGYDGTNGWIIGDDRKYDSAEYQDFVESESIYDMLEHEIIPAFYDRGSDGLPRRWIARMRASMRTCGPKFSAARMVREYADKLYVPVMRVGGGLTDNAFEGAKALAKWKERIRDAWSGAYVESFEISGDDEQSVGSTLGVRAMVHLGTLQPDEVVVQIYVGAAPTDGHINEGTAIEMTPQGAITDGKCEYAGQIPCHSSGRHAFGVRIMPCYPADRSRVDLNLIKWGN